MLIHAGTPLQWCCKREVQQDKGERGPEGETRVGVSVFGS